MSSASQRRFGLLMTVGFAALCAVGAVGLLAVQRAAQDSHHLFNVQQLLMRQQDADMMRDAVRGDVFAAVAGIDETTSVLVALQQHADRGRRQLNENKRLAPGHVPASLVSKIVAAGEAFESYAAAAYETAEAASTGSTRGVAAFSRQFTALETQLADLSKLLHSSAEDAHNQADATANRARWETLVLLIATLGLFGALW